MNFSFEFISDIGRVRDINEDYYGYYFNKLIKGYLFCVADGMGGYENGDVASKSVIESVIRDFRSIRSPNIDIDKLLNLLFINANNRLNELKKDKKISQFGTTLSIILFINSSVWFANLGDTRIYTLKESILTQKNFDHSYVNVLLKNNQITKEESLIHPKKNILVSALNGEEFKINPYILKEEISLKTTYIIASDGLYNFVEEDTIANILNKYDLKIAIQKLIEVANNNGGKDNITIEAIRVD